MVKNTDSTYASIYREADEAGREAVQKLEVIPMIVSQHKNPLDDNSKIVKSWYISDGVCGFASIWIKPANCKFAKYLVKNGKARKSGYQSGVCIWVSDFNQSLQKKEAYAQAFAKVLVKNGITAWAESRID